ASRARRSALAPMSMPAWRRCCGLGAESAGTSCFCGSVMFSTSCPSVKTFTLCQGQTPQAQPSARCLYPASDHPPVTGAVVLDPGVVSTPLVDEESSPATRTVTTTPTSTITPTTAKTT